MNLHEYQGKQLFAEYGLPVSRGYAVETPKQAVDAAEQIGGNMWVVKAQVHAGGRGKAGGVKLVRTKDEIREFAMQWLGRNLVTYQTDEKGQPVSKILVETCTDIAEELYLGAVVDRSFAPHRVHGVHRGRRGDRESRPRDAGEDTARPPSTR